jgi:hypothetical protein
VGSFYAKSANALKSDSVKCTLDSGTTNMAVSVVGISGANQAAIFDTNAAVPCEANQVSGTSVSCNTSTNNAKDLIIGAFVTSGNSPGTLTAGTGFTMKTSSGNYGPESGIEYDLVSATQTNLPVSVGWVTAGLRAVMVVDVIAG